MLVTTSAFLGPNLKKLQKEGSYGNSSTVKIAMGENPDFNLQYLTLRALADLPAAMLEFSDTSYTATYFGREEFKKIKPTLPLGRLPLLKHHGVVISQSGSIIRYIAGETGLDGDNERERAKIDMIFETVKELFGGHRTITFDGAALANVTQFHDFVNSGNPILHFRETTNRGTYDKIMKSAAVLKTFNDMLSINARNQKFLVGHKASYADLALFHQLEKAHETTLPNLYQVLTNLGFRRLLEHYLEFSGNMLLSQYLSSDRRMPPIEYRDGDYHYIFPAAPEDDPEHMQIEETIPHADL